MPIMTKYMSSINFIVKSDFPDSEKIRRLREITVTEKEGSCHHCRRKIAATKKLLQQMVDSEIKKIGVSENT